MKWRPPSDDDVLDKSNGEAAGDETAVAKEAESPRKHISPAAAVRSLLEEARTGTTSDANKLVPFPLVAAGA